MDKRARIIGAVTLVLACAFIAYGIYRGEVGIVLNKAVNICFECIGLG